MGWKTSIIAVKERTIKDLLQDQLDVFCPTGQVVRAEIASSKDLDGTMALAEIDGWCVILQPGEAAANAEVLDSLSLKTQAVGIMVSSVTSRYALRVHENGHECRFILYREGTVDAEGGLPLSAEDGIERPSWGDGEDWAFTSLDRLTGLTWARIEAHPFTVVGPDFPPR